MECISRDTGSNTGTKNYNMKELWGELTAAGCLHPEEDANKQGQLSRLLVNVTRARK